MLPEGPAGSLRFAAFRLCSCAFVSLRSASRAFVECSLVFVCVRLRSFAFSLSRMPRCSRCRCCIHMQAV